MSWICGRWMMGSRRCSCKGMMDEEVMKARAERPYDKCK